MFLLASKIPLFLKVKLNGQPSLVLTQTTSDDKNLLKKRDLHPGGPSNTAIAPSYARFSDRFRSPTSKVLTSKQPEQPSRNLCKAVVRTTGNISIQLTPRISTSLISFAVLSSFLF
jgi:hypothetical protein